MEAVAPTGLLATPALIPVLFNHSMSSDQILWCPLKLELQKQPEEKPCALEGLFALCGSPQGQCSFDASNFGTSRSYHIVEVLSVLLLALMRKNLESLCRRPPRFGTRFEQLARAIRNDHRQLNSSSRATQLL